MSVDVLAGDKDADRDPLTLTSVGKAKHGTVTRKGGKAVYELTDPAFEGRDRSPTSLRQPFGLRRPAWSP